MELNLLGEVYTQYDVGKFYMVDKDCKFWLYQELSSYDDIDIFPVFAYDGGSQIIYETKSSATYKTILETQKYRCNDKRKVTLETMIFLTKKRSRFVMESNFSETYLDDIDKLVMLGMRDFKFNTENVKLNDLLNNGYVLKRDNIRINSTDYYTSANSLIKIKRLPETIGTCSELKFQTKDMRVLGKLVEDLNVVDDYMSSEIFLKDLDLKLKFVFNMITVSNNVDINLRILNVLKLAVNNPIKTAKIATGRLLLSNITTNSNIFDNISRQLNINVSQHLKSIYDYKRIEG